jgi:hypothetical protein
MLLNFQRRWFAREGHIGSPLHDAAMQSLIVTAEPAGHTDSGLLLVSVVASARTWTGQYRVWRRHVARLRPFPRGAAAFRATEDAAGQGERRGSRLHGEGVQGPQRQNRSTWPPQPSRAAEFRFRAISRRNDGRLLAQLRPGASRVLPLFSLSNDGGLDDVCEHRAMEPDVRRPVRPRGGNRKLRDLRATPSPLYLARHRGDD